MASQADLDSSMLDFDSKYDGTSCLHCGFCWWRNIFPLKLNSTQLTTPKEKEWFTRGKKL